MHSLRTLASYGLKLITAPDDEPISRDEAKKQSEVAKAIVVHDSHFERLIRSARIRAEELTGRQITTATWELWLDGFPCGRRPLVLPRPPLQVLTHVKYIDANGTLQTLPTSDYKVTTAREPAEIHPAYGLSWPITRCEPDAVQVRFTAGYGAPADVPELLKQALLMMTDDWFSNRHGEGEPSQAARNLLEQFGFGDEFCRYAE